MLIFKRSTALISLIIIGICIMPSFAQKEKKGGILRYARGGDSVTLDPGAQWDTESTKVATNIFETLVRYKPGSTEIEPALATSWTISPDKLTWIFTLRPQVFFHDDSPLDGDAVVYSFTRQFDKKHPGHYDDFNWWNSMFDMVESVSALGKDQVQIVLGRPYAPFLSNMAMPCASIVSPKSAMAHGDKMGQYPAGTGPFRFISWEAGDKIVLEANEKYWDGRPNLDRLIFTVMPDNGSRLLALRSGSIDIMDGVLPKDAPLIKRTAGLMVLEEPGINICYLCMNNTRPPFDDIRVRQAINHALNKVPLVRIFYQRGATPAVNPMPPSLWGYNDEIKDYDYNPSEAKRLLREAGFENGITAELLVMPIARPYCPEPESFGRAIAKSLAGSGINANVKVSPTWDNYLDDTDYARFDMALLGWVGDNGDPDNFLYVLLSKQNAESFPASNAALYRSEETSKLLSLAQGEHDQAKRSQLYKKAQEQIHKDAPWVPLAYANDILALRSIVKGMAIHPTGIMRLQRVWIDSE